MKDIKILQNEMRQRKSGKSFVIKIIEMCINERGGVEREMKSSHAKYSIIKDKSAE